MTAPTLTDEQHERGARATVSMGIATPTTIALLRLLDAERAKVARVRTEVERLEARFPSVDQVGHEVARWFRAALADQPEQKDHHG